MPDESLDDELEHKMRNMSNTPWLFLTFFTIALDQWTKNIAVTELMGNPSIPVIPPVLSWTYAENHGAAFSFLADAGGWQRHFFTVLAIVVSFVLIIWLLRLGKGMKTLAASLALILGGAIGNVLDRMNYGYVIDFIHVHWHNAWHFPVFNIADCAITLGVILMLIDTLFLESKRNPNVKDAK